MKTRLLLPLAGAAMLAASAITPAHAVLTVSFQDGGSVFTCADGGLCDFAGSTGNLLTLNTDVGAFHIFGTLSTSQSGASNVLSLSNFGVINTGATERTLTMVVSNTGYTAPVAFIHESASLTFGNNVGAGDSTLQFYADAGNTQGAGNPIVIPGTKVFEVSAAPADNPDSFAGTHTSIFPITTTFSMTEVGLIDLVGGGSLTGFNQNMRTQPTPIPAAALLLPAGIAGVGAFGRWRRKRSGA